MVTVRMVQMTFHQIVRVVSVGHCFVSTVGPVFMALLVASAIMVRGTRRRVFPAHADLVFVNIVDVRVVKVPVVKIVLMALVPYDRMSAVRTVHVSMPFVNLMIGCHLSPHLTY